MVARQMLDDRRLRAAFFGWVKVEFVRGAAVRFFDGGREIAGRVIDATVAEHDRLAVPHEVVVRVQGPVAAGSPGMFDQGVGPSVDCTWIVYEPGSA